MLVSLPDAVNPAHSIKTTFSILPYLFVGVFIIYFLDTEDIKRKLNIAILCVTSFWCIDAIFQLIFDVNIFGHTYISDTRLSGIFYPKFTLGLVLALLLPMILEQLRKMAKSNAGLFFAIVIASMHIAVIILSGSRNALLMLVIGIPGWFFYVLYITRSINWQRLALAVVISIPVVVLLSLLQPTRHDTLIDVPATDIKTLDKISNHRLALWDAAVGMSQDHWINGIGPRGFRHLYKDYRPKEGKYNYDYDEKGSTHPHFALLEITAETGLIGLTGILILLFLLYKKLNELDDIEKLDVYPWFLGVTIAIVPNIAKAFYSTFWMSIVLCMLFIGIASISDSDKKAR